MCPLPFSILWLWSQALCLVCQSCCVGRCCFIGVFYLLFLRDPRTFSWGGVWWRHPMWDWLCQGLLLTTHRLVVRFCVDCCLFKEASGRVEGSCGLCPHKVPQLLGTGVTWGVTKEWRWSGKKGWEGHQRRTKIPWVFTERLSSYGIEED